MDCTSQEGVHTLVSVAFAGLLGKFLLSQLGKVPSASPRVFSFWREIPRRVDCRQKILLPPLRNPSPLYAAKQRVEARARQSTPLSHSALIHEDIVEILRCMRKDPSQMNPPPLSLSDHPTEIEAPVPWAAEESPLRPRKLPPPPSWIYWTPEEVHGCTSLAVNTSASGEKLGRISVSLGR